MSTAVCYLDPARSRPNLSIVANALTEGLLFEGKRCVGVRYNVQGQRREARATREVVISAGSINSPQLLMLSGIGDAGALRGHGIASVVHLPGVGANFQDHLCVNVAHLRLGASPLQHTLRADRVAIAMLQSWLEWVFVISTSQSLSPSAPPLGRLT